MKPLVQFYNEHKGKASDKWDLYLGVYNNEFTGHRDAPINLLEIGVQNGGSLEIWDKYFHNAQNIIGCDIDDKCGLLEFESSCIQIIVGDAGSKNTLEQITKISPSFDIVIDDGSHTSGDIIKSFLLYFPILSDGGIFVAEDLHCSYWEEFEGGLYNPYSSVSFFKALADVLNYEHWGTDADRYKTIDNILDKYNCEISSESLIGLHSIKFVNSVCIIQKRSPEINSIGVRVVVGSEEDVKQGNLLMDGSELLAPDQSSSSWNISQLDDNSLVLNNRIETLGAVLVARDSMIEDLNEKLQGQVNEIGNLQAVDNANFAQISKHADLISLRETQVSELLELNSVREGQIHELQELNKQREDQILILENRNQELTASIELFAQPNKDLENQSNGLFVNFWRKFSKFFQLCYFNVRFILILVKQIGIGGVVKRLISSYRAGGLSVTIYRYRKVRSQHISSQNIEVLEDKMTLRRDVDIEKINYVKFIAETEPSESDLKVMEQEGADFPYRPKFSIVVPVYNTDKIYLLEFVESVIAQTYTNWELCIADDCSTKGFVKPLLEKFAKNDDRIKVVFRKENGHISACTNSALELATGDYICLMDNDDKIARNSLHEFVSLLNQDQTLDMIYSDEDKLDLAGHRYEPFFKPDWSPETLEACMYTAHFACYRASIVHELKGFRSECDGAQDYDFVLRFTEKTQRIAHIPKVLYHWRAIPGSTAYSMDEKNYTLDSATRALSDRMDRVWTGGEVVRGQYAGCFDLRYKIKGNPKISIIIPSAGRSAVIRGRSIDLLHNVVRSINQNTTYKNYEIIIVDNDDLSDDTIQLLSKFDCKFVHFHEEFNVAKKMNLGAKIATGDYFLFLNDDVEIITPNWLESMLQLCQRPQIGAVGAKLIFENETAQHLGVAFWNGLPDHIRRGFDRNDPGYFFSSCANRNYLAVTGAVVLTPRKEFEDVKGFDEDFAINYNDIDYCLKLYELGQRTVYCASAQLYHFESVSREAFVADNEIDLFLKKWKEVTENDPYYGKYFDDHPPNFFLKEFNRGTK